MNRTSLTTKTFDRAFLARQRRALASRLVEQERTLHELHLLNDEARYRAAITADDDQNAYGQQLVDQLECESLEHRTRAIIGEIRAATERLDQDSYGRCLDCRQPIDPERLMALPEVALCASCRVCMLSSSLVSSATSQQTVPRLEPGTSTPNNDSKGSGDGSSGVGAHHQVDRCPPEKRTRQDRDLLRGERICDDYFI